MLKTDLRNSEKLLLVEYGITQDEYKGYFMRMIFMLVANHLGPGRGDGEGGDGGRDHQELIDRIDRYLRDRRDLCEKDFLFQDCGTEMLRGDGVGEILRGGIGVSQNQIE